MTINETWEYIDILNKKGIVPGLDNIRNLASEIGDPQDELRFVHIAGTNGKGSTLAYISSILKAAGLKVGRYVSPTISDYRERIQICNRMISQKDLCGYMEQMKTACERMQQKGTGDPTAFEVETVMSWLYFRDKGCDIVVCETGMGGLSDATNIIKNTEVAVLTSIGMDHMKFLGDTIEKIAAQKAGIIKKDCTVVAMRQYEDYEGVCRVIEEASEGKAREVVWSDATKATHIKQSLKKQIFDYEELKRLEIHLVGTYQIANACLAIDTVRALNKRWQKDKAVALKPEEMRSTEGLCVTESAIRKGLCEAVWPVRFEVLSEKPLFIADGAHNEDAARKLVPSIEKYLAGRRLIFILGMLGDKDYTRVIELTCRYPDQVITLTPPENKRAMNALDLALEVAKVNPNVTAVDSVEEAVELARLLAGKNGAVLAFGSLSYMGRLRSIVLVGQQA